MVTEGSEGARSDDKHRHCTRSARIVYQDQRESPFIFGTWPARGHSRMRMRMRRQRVIRVVTLYHIQCVWLLYYRTHIKMGTKKFNYEESTWMISLHDFMYVILLCLPVPPWSGGHLLLGGHARSWNIHHAGGHLHSPHARGSLLLLHAWDCGGYLSRHVHAGLRGLGKVRLDAYTGTERISIKAKDKAEINKKRDQLALSL